MKKKISILLIILTVLLSTMPMTAFAEGEAQSICILATSDVHCLVNKRASQVEGQGPVCENIGYTGVAAYRDSMATEHDNVILVDNGDFLQGDLIGFYNKGESIANIMNATGYDVVVPGNHDFDYGASHFIDNIADKYFSGRVVSCNFMHKKEQVFSSYKMIECGEKKIAFVGITTPSTLVTCRPDSFKDESGNIVYDFCNDMDGTKLYNKVQESIDAAISAGANYVIACGHLGNEGGDSYVWDSSDVIANTEGITAFIDGHAHQKFDESMKNKKGEDVPCIAVGTQLTHLGKIVIDESGKVDASIVTAQDTIEMESKTVTDVVNQEWAAVAEKEAEVIGNSDVLLDINDENGRAVRKKETNIGDFVTDAYRYVTGADIVIVNGGAIRTSVNAGEVTYGDIFKVHPFGNTLCMCEATGQQIMDALEFGARNTPDSELGGFLQVSGLSYKIDPTIKSSIRLDAAGNFIGYSNNDRKVYDVMVGDKPLDLNKRYKVASSNFIIKSGGDGMNMFVNDNRIVDESMYDCDALISYIKEGLEGQVGTKYEKPQGRIVIAKKDNGGDQPVVPTEPTESEVDTGDYNNIVPYVISMAVALIAAILLIVMRKKN